MTGKTEREETQGILLRADNGDVVSFDETGITLRLSDKVIADISMRLGLEAVTRVEPSNRSRISKRLDPHEAIEGVDAWNLFQQDDWLHFTAHLPGKQGIRGFRRHIEGGDIVADAPGALRGILGIGGARAALGNLRPSHFPQHVLAPADDIGAVGHAGVDEAALTDQLEHIREITHEALVAETILNWQLEKHQAMPVFMTRVETDQSSTAEELSKGAAFDNLIVAAKNLSQAADRMGKKSELCCITIDFALEDQSGSATAYRDGVLDLMTRASDAFSKLGYHQPRFVARFESGTSEITKSAVLEGQWDLGWNHGDHNFTYSAPSYMFALDDYDRPTDAARTEMSEMTAMAISADQWSCPVFLLAEHSTKSPDTIRVTARAMSALVVDADDPLGAGIGAGFTFIGAENGAQITSVSTDPEDPDTLLLNCDKPPVGDDLQLAYAYAAPPRPGAYPANCGAVRDGWVMESATGRKLHRWALPCLLPVTAGGNDV